MGVRTLSDSGALEGLIAKILRDLGAKKPDSFAHVARAGRQRREVDDSQGSERDLTSGRCGVTFPGFWDGMFQDSGTPMTRGVRVDLAHYAVNAVLVEGRSVRAVAAATGTSKSWVQRHVQLFRDGGAEASSLDGVVRDTRPPSPHLRSKTRSSGGASTSVTPIRCGARTIRYHLSQAHRACPRSRPASGAAPSWSRGRPAPKAASFELGALRGRAGQ